MSVTLQDWLTKALSVKIAAPLYEELSAQGIDTVERLKLLVDLNDRWTDDLNVQLSSWNRSLLNDALKSVNGKPLSQLSVDELAAAVAKSFPGQDYAARLHAAGIAGNHVEFWMSRDIISHAIGVTDPCQTHVVALEGLVARWKSKGVPQFIYLGKRDGPDWVQSSPPKRTPPACPSVDKSLAEGSSDTVHSLLDGGADERALFGPRQLMTSAQFSHSMTTGASVIPSEGFGLLRISREALVKKIVLAAETSDNSYVFLQGPRGCGKTQLLEQIGQYLQASGRAVLIATSPRDLDRYFDRYPNSKDWPECFLVDEVQLDFGSKGVRFLAGKFPNRPKLLTVFAGTLEDPRIGSEVLCSCLEVEDLLFSADELLTGDVLDYFARRVKDYPHRDAAVPEGAVDPTQNDTAQYLRAAEVALTFAHTFTSGHCFPCLALADYLVRVLPSQLLTSTGVNALLVRELASDTFLAAGGSYRTIVARCFESLRCSAERMLLELQSGAQGDRDLYTLGLWLFREGKPLSPMVHMALRYFARNTHRPVHLARQFSDALAYSLGRVGWDKLPPCGPRPEDMACCLNGVRVALGRELAAIYSVVSLQEGMLSAAVRRAKHPPPLDFYVGHPADRYLELVSDRTSLPLQCARFEPGGVYDSNHSSTGYAMLEIAFDSDVPVPLPTALSKYQSTFYTYCVRSQTL